MTVHYRVPVPGVSPAHVSGGFAKRRSDRHTAIFHYTCVAIYPHEQGDGFNTTWHTRRDLAMRAKDNYSGRSPSQIIDILPEHMRITRTRGTKSLDYMAEQYRRRDGKTAEERNADRIDGYDRDDLGESPDC